MGLAILGIVQVFAALLKWSIEWVKVAQVRLHAETAAVRLVDDAMLVGFATSLPLTPATLASITMGYHNQRFYRRKGF